MVYFDDDIIKWTCSNWYLRDDKLIQISTQDGGKVILNKIFSRIWLTIHYEQTFSKLFSELLDLGDKSTLSSYLVEMKKCNLITIVNSANEFDMIFG